MYSDKRVMYSISISIFTLLFLALFVPTGSGRILAAVLLLPAAAVTYFCVKKRSILSINKQQILLLMSVIGLLYLMIYYLTGLRFGFLRSSVRLSASSFIKYILPITSIIISVEIIRSVLVAQNKKIVDVFSYLLCVTAEVLISSNISQIHTFNKFMDVVGLTLFPAVIANLLYHYLSRRYGAYPNIIYRLLITLYAYIIPYVPAISDSLFAFAKLIVPLIIFWFIDSLYEKKRRFAAYKKSKLSYVGIIVAAAAMISIVMLVSCQFRFGALVVGSESMTGELNKGDAVIYERYENQIIQIGQVIVFEKSNSVIIHRVADIKRINGVNRYYTQGDANDELDAGYITDKQIVGVANVKVPYVGYPTIWVRNLFSQKLRGD